MGHVTKPSRETNTLPWSRSQRRYKGSQRTAPTRPTSRLLPGALRYPRHHPHPAPPPNRHIHTAARRQDPSKELLGQATQPACFTRVNGACAAKSREPTRLSPTQVQMASCSVCLCETGRRKPRPVACPLTPLVPHSQSHVTRRGCNARQAHKIPCHKRDPATMLDTGYDASQACY